MLAGGGMLVVVGHSNVEVVHSKWNTAMLCSTSLSASSICDVVESIECRVVTACMFANVSVAAQVKVAPRKIRNIIPAPIAAPSLAFWNGAKRPAQMKVPHHNHIATAMNLLAARLSKLD